MKLKSNIFIFVLFLLVFMPISFVFAQSTASSNPRCDYNKYEIQISILNQKIQKLEKELNYYKNLYEHYKKLYENSNVTLNRSELLHINSTLYTINNNITQLFQITQHIDQKFSQFEFKYSIFGSLVGSLFSISLIRITYLFNLFKNIKRKNNEKNKRNQKSN